MSETNCNNNQQKQNDDPSVLVRPTSSLKRIKSEKSPNRLPSLRGPRDLTLGGIKKKIFTPTIPIRKDRTKPENLAGKLSKHLNVGNSGGRRPKDEKPLSKVKNEKRPRFRDSTPRGRERTFKKNVIQSHSIFEARPDAAPRMQGRESAPSYGESQIQKPTIKKEKLDSAKEKSESDEAMRRLAEGNTALIADLQNDEKLGPVVLPLNATDARVADQTRDFASDVFRTTDRNLILLQIPDTLPDIPPSSDDAPVGVKQEVDQNERSGYCPIDRMNEGKIGKLQLMKSGRCRLLLKGVHLDLKIGTPTSFAQEVASVRLPPEGSEDDARGQLSVLGEVCQKVVCVPNMSALIETT